MNHSSQYYFVNGCYYCLRLRRWVRAAQPSGTPPPSSFPASGTYHAGLRPWSYGNPPNWSSEPSHPPQYVAQVAPPQLSGVYNQRYGTQLTLSQATFAAPSPAPVPPQGLSFYPQINMSHRYAVQHESAPWPPVHAPNMSSGSHLPSPSTSTFSSPKAFPAPTMSNGLPPVPSDPTDPWRLPDPTDPRLPALTILRQSEYTRGQPFDSDEKRIPTVFFGAQSLQEALDGDCASLGDRTRPAWAKELRTATKLSIVFCFEGHALYTHQAHLRTRGGPPDRAQLAQVVAKEMRRFMAKNQNEPLRVHGRSVDFKELLLVEVEHVSKGSLQPKIGVASRSQIG